MKVCVYFLVEVITNLQLHGLIFTYFSNINNAPQISDGVIQRFLKVILNEFRVIFPCSTH